MDKIAALRLFVRLAEHESFSAAARDLKIKQSTASKWVAELEAELGTSLVQRTTRSVHLTEAGRQLLLRARNVLSAFDELGQDFAHRNPVPSGRLRLSVPVVFGRLFVLPALAAFLARYEQVQAELSFNDRYVSLVEEELDLTVRVGLPVDTSARGRKLADSRRVLVASPGYLATHGRPRTPKDLEKHQCLLHGEIDAATVWRFGRTPGAEAPIAVRGRLAANNSEGVLALARHGLGLALLADWLVEGDLKRGRLVPLLEDFHAPPAPIYALTPPGRFVSTTVRVLIEHLAAALESRLLSAS